MRTILITTLFGLAFFLGIAIAAHASTATTSLEVVIPISVTIGAEVACNPENCPQTWEEEPVQVQSVQPEGRWWTKMVEWIRTFIT